MSKTFPAIPDPIQTTDSMLETIRALKIAVELLIGVRGTVAPTKTYMQQGYPTAERIGDMWVNAYGDGKLYVWDGTNWSVVKV